MCVVRCYIMGLLVGDCYRTLELRHGETDETGTKLGELTSRTIKRSGLSYERIGPERSRCHRKMTEVSKVTTSREDKQLERKLL